MTEIRKRVLDVCKQAEFSDIADTDEWKKKYKSLAIEAVIGYDEKEKKWVCNRTMVQETVQFTEISLRDVDVVAMTVSWTEKVEQTGDINLQTATCIKAFGNVY